MQPIEDQQQRARRRDNILHYISTTFPVLTVTPFGQDNEVRVRIRKSIGELMHAFGYYGDQNAHEMRDLSMHQRLLLMADVLTFIAANLEKN